MAQDFVEKWGTEIWNYRRDMDGGLAIKKVDVSMQLNKMY